MLQFSLIIVIDGNQKDILHNINKAFFYMLKSKSLIWIYSIYTALIILFYILPINSSESGINLNNVFIVYIRLDYLALFMIFFPWMILWKKCTRMIVRKNVGNKIGIITVGFLFTIGLELIQYYLPYRAFNINDLIANGIGAGIGAIFFIR